MKANSLYTQHPRSLTTLYSDLDHQSALERTILIGTPGSLIERSNGKGFRYYAHQFYDVFGKKKEKYLSGPVGDETAEAIYESLKLQIEEQRETVSEIRLLGREGYQITDKKTYATIATLHNHQFFRAGGILIGSHAFGVLLNHLGIRAPSYATEDIDLARPYPLEFEPPLKINFLEMLQASSISFIAIPPFNRKDPSVQWKERGRTRFHVDLLTHSNNENFTIVSIPELGVYAQGIPYLRYLLSESHFATLLSRHGSCQVRVPIAERFAIHKLLVSQFRTGHGAKVNKDLEQAKVLIAALGELHNGALTDALHALPISVRSKVKKSLNALQATLESKHPQSWEECIQAIEDW